MNRFKQDNTTRDFSNHRFNRWCNKLSIGSLTTIKGDVKDVPILIGMVIKAALSIVGALSLFVFIVGGFTWLTSAGNPEKVTKGAKTMVWAVLGLVVVFASYMIVGLLLKI